MHNKVLHDHGEPDDVDPDDDFRFDIIYRHRNVEDGVSINIKTNFGSMNSTYKGRHFRHDNLVKEFTVISVTFLIQRLNVSRLLEYLREYLVALKKAECF